MQFPNISISPKIEKLIKLQEFIYNFNDDSIPLEISIFQDIHPEFIAKECANYPNNHPHTQNLICKIIIFLIENCIFNRDFLQELANIVMYESPQLFFHLIEFKVYKIEDLIDYKLSLGFKSAYFLIPYCSNFSIFKSFCPYYFRWDYSQEKHFSNWKKIYNKYYYNEKKKYQELIQYGFKKDSLGYIIKYDEIEKLISYSSEIDFDFNMNLKTSLFEVPLRYSTISLINASAFYGSVQSFRYLLVNGSKTDSDTCLRAIQGGNIDLIRLFEENMNLNQSIITASNHHHTDVFIWLVSKVTDPIISLKNFYEKINVFSICFLINKNKESQILTSDNPLESLHHDFQFDIFDLLVNNGYYHFLEDNISNNLNYFCRKNDISKILYFIQKGVKLENFTEFSFYLFYFFFSL